MNWLSFAIFVWLFLGLDAGLANALQLGDMAIAPSFVMVLLAFVALWASSAHAVWAALLIGVLLDFTTPIHTTSGSTVVIVGPNALGCLLGASLILNLRSLMFRKNVITIAVLALVTMLIAEIVVTATLSFRQMYDEVAFGKPLSELLTRSASALYTGVLALPVGLLLTAIRPIFSFQQAQSRLSFPSRHSR